MIKRLEQRSQYVLLSCAVVRFGGLTPEELGLYVMMLVRPDHWDFYEKILAKEAEMTPERILEILRSMERKGFVLERSGRFGRFWDLIEMPERVAEAERKMFAENGWRPCLSETMPEPRPQVSDETPKPGKRESAPEPGKRTLTHEQMAQIFFEKAAELRKCTEEEKAAKAAGR